MGHIAEPRKRAAEADARLYDAIENGVADLAVPDDSCSEATNSSLRTRGKGCEAQNTIIKCYGRSRPRRAFSPERWSPAPMRRSATTPSGRAGSRRIFSTAGALQHVPTAMNWDSQDTPEVRV